MSRKREAGAPVLILLSDLKDQHLHHLPKYTIIDSSKFLIGRSPESNLTILQTFISRKHCTFTHDEDNNKWSIISHSRKAVSVQGKDLKAEDSIILECGDKIKISPLIVFEFKCSPDSRYKCCMDFKRPRLSSEDEQEKEDDVQPIPNADDINIRDASYPNMGYLDDDDYGFFQDSGNVNEDAPLILNEDDVDKDIEPISNVNIDEEDVPLGNDFELPSTLPVSQLPSTLPVSPLPSTLPVSPLPSTLPVSPLPNTLPISLLPDSSHFNHSFGNCSDSVTESFSKADSDSISFVGIDSLPQSDDNLNITTSPNIDNLENEIRNYANRDKRNSGKKAANHQKLIDELHYRLEFLKKFDKFKSSCEAYHTNPSDGHKLNTSMNELASFFQDKCSEFDCQNVKTSNKKSDENLIRIVLDMYAILMEKAQQATSFICKFLESTDNKELPDCFENSQSYLSDDKSQNTHHHDDYDTLVREKNELQTEMEKIKEENRKYNENMSWQESRIKFLELKVKEKEKLELELETSKEETEMLEKQNADLKRNLADLEIMELEYKNILETNKYREEDKRNKDALQRTINTLEDQLKGLKDDNAQLVNDKCLTQEEITKLQAKCKDLEEKVKEKIIVATSSVAGCANGNKSGEEYCCDMVKEVKASLIELLEREFQCSICGELMIESTVTNCNHVFCTFCLQEWKKKQKKCPICRAALVKEVRAFIIDNYVTDLLKLISESLYSERIKVISDRTTKKTPVPAASQAKARNARRNSRQAAPIVDLS